jgi:hypothetical protein
VRKEQTKVVLISQYRQKDGAFFFARLTLGAEMTLISGSNLHTWLGEVVLLLPGRRLAIWVW